MLGTYNAHNTTIRDDIEKALQKLNKAEIVKEVYRSILNDIDSGVTDKEEDIFSVKRQYFNTRRNDIIEKFAETWFVDPEQLYSSALQYRAKMDGVPNNSGIMNNSDFKSFKEVTPDVSMIAYLGKLIPEWEKVLTESIIFLDEELK